MNWPLGKNTGWRGKEFRVRVVCGFAKQMCGGTGRRGIFLTKSGSRGKGGGEGREWVAALGVLYM